ncbi:hypothetical protein L6R29_04140 [Myxococcota bacterium]|nr:hypothetical protein [Myxococcota bacterium]
MIEIRIQIEVHNAEELARQKKGGWVTRLARWAGVDLQRRAEEAIAKEVVQGLRERFLPILQEQGVEATLRLEHSVVLHQ